MTTITADTAALTATHWHPHYRRSEELGQEITELCGYIYAATYRLLEMDECRRQHDEWALHVYYEPDGSMVFRVRMPAEKGALLLKAIERAANRAEQDVSADMLIRLSSGPPTSCVCYEASM